MRASPMLVVLFAALALAACSKKKKPAGPPAYEELCAVSCERISECNAEVDGEQCRLDCINTFTPYGDQLRDDFVQEIQQCMLDSRCRDLGVTAIDNDCRRDATERIGVSLKTVEMCESVNDTLRRCTLGDPGRGYEGCQQAFKIFTDETLEEAIQCKDVECRELGKCFTAALGFSSPMPPPIGGASGDESE